MTLWELEKLFKGGVIMEDKFSDLIDKESILLDRKRLADFNNGRRLENKIDDIMIHFLHMNSVEIGTEGALWVFKFAEEIKTKLGGIR